MAARGRLVLLLMRVKWKAKRMQKRTTNIIIKLKEKGWSADEIIAFLAYIETHSPSEDEAKRALEQ